MTLTNPEHEDQNRLTIMSNYFFTLKKNIPYLKTSCNNLSTSIRI